MICIIDYGAGNIGSISNMLRRLGAQSIVSSNPEDIKAAEKLILPGVGSFDHGMEQLQNSGLIDVLTQKVINDRTPILGICLGAQLMTKNSDEGQLPGLGWFDAEVKKFSFPEGQQNFRIPHMGWNHITIQNENKLTKDLPADARFYFVHSYYMKANKPSDIMMETKYSHEFVSGISHDNIYAVQFHPEKSHKFGLKLFQNFLDI